MRPLKFLGCVYDGNVGLFRAATRKGATLEFDNATAFLVWLASNAPSLGTKYTKGMRATRPLAEALDNW